MGKYTRQAMKSNRDKDRQMKSYYSSAKRIRESHKIRLFGFLR